MLRRTFLPSICAIFLMVLMASPLWAAKGGNGGGGGGKPPKDDPPSELPPIEYTLEILLILDESNPSSFVNAMNEAGEMVGRSGDRAALWTDEGVIDLNDLLPEGSDWVLWEADDINNVGQIVGYGLRPDLSQDLRPFRYTPGDPAIFEDLSTLGMSTAKGINDLGDVTGKLTDGGGTIRGYVYTGTPGDLDANELALIPMIENHHSTAPRAINNNGQVVGEMAVTGGNVEWWAFRYSPDAEPDQQIELLALNEKGSVQPRSAAWDINNQGWTVGESYLSSKAWERAFRFKDSSGIKDLGAFSGKISQAYAINESGEVVGKSFNGAAYRGFIYIDEFGMVNLDDLVVGDDADLGDWSAGNVYPRAINNSGVISGYFTGPGDAVPKVPFVLTPQPLP